MKDLGRIINIIFGVIGVAGFFAGVFISTIEWIVTGDIPEYQAVIRFAVAIIFCVIMSGVGFAIYQKYD